MKKKSNFPTMFPLYKCYPAKLIAKDLVPVLPIECHKIHHKIIWYIGGVKQKED